MINLRLSPRAFWRLTPEEWRWLTAVTAEETLSRADLLALHDQYPDKTYGSEN
ncbi:MAG: phage tail assembly chaperone [Pseudomonadota bacterium]